MKHFKYDKDWKEYLSLSLARKYHMDEHRGSSRGVPPIYIDWQVIESYAKSLPVDINEIGGEIYCNVNTFYDQMTLGRMSGRSYLTLCELLNAELSTFLVNKDLVIYQPDPEEEPDEDGLVECYPISEEEGAEYSLHVHKPWTLNGPIDRTISGVCKDKDGRVLLCFADEGDAVTTSSVNEIILTFFFGKDRKCWIGKRINISPSHYATESGSKPCFDIVPSEKFIFIDDLLEIIEEGLKECGSWMFEHLSGSYRKWIP